MAALTSFNADPCPCCGYSSLSYSSNNDCTQPHTFHSSLYLPLNSPAPQVSAIDPKPRNRLERRAWDTVKNKEAFIKHAEEVIGKVESEAIYEDMFWKLLKRTQGHEPKQAKSTK